jgi:hypothetical protein
VYPPPPLSAVGIGVSKQSLQMVVSVKGIGFSHTIKNTINYIVGRRTARSGHLEKFLIGGPFRVEYTVFREIVGPTFPSPTAYWLYIPKDLISCVPAHPGR